MRLVPPNHAPTTERPRYGKRGAAALDDVVERLAELPAALAPLLYATNSDSSDEARRVATAYAQVTEAVTKLFDPVYREPTKALAHGIAFGLWYAGKPELIRDCPDWVRNHVWTLPFAGREDLLKAAAKAH